MICVCVCCVYVYMCVCVCAHVYVGAGGLCGASDYWGMARGSPYLSVALLLALGIGGRVCGGGARWVRWHGGLFMNIWWRACFTLRRVYQHYLFMNSKHHKRDAFLINCLWLKKWNIYVNTNRMCKATNY